LGERERKVSDTSPPCPLSKRGFHYGVGFCCFERGINLEEGLAPLLDAPFVLVILESRFIGTKNLGAGGKTLPL
jgi:hypothetical protein